MKSIRRLTIPDRMIVVVLLMISLISVSWTLTSCQDRRAEIPNPNFIASSAGQYPLKNHPVESLQDESLKFEHLTLENGLSQSTINAIVQDRQGFMWFGTQDGLNRYDGYDFKIFKHDADIHDQDVLPILVDGHVFPHFPQTTQGDNS